ncbi:hypothetical protein IRT45_28265 [Nocardia sp. BSTN01]|uniref:hypothetical protein n=1 Tax=Nocardia sp. BSTN01 TaxID=2783665 RepID=UPI00188FF515|nr:hypothetical protein [Nocardia sp. BSTN01]MBF5001036.1 hypothetical protein [Nocardia sp. BSTN01]
MTEATAAAAGNYLVDVAERLNLGCDPATIRAVFARACGGRLATRMPDGRRASGLTITGTPFEVSVAGGRGRYTPAIRYLTEAGTDEAVFTSRIDVQLAAIRDLVDWLPNGGRKAADVLCSFVTTLYPDPAHVSRRQRSATWTGIVHHSAAPSQLNRLKVYGTPPMVPKTLERLYSVLPGFHELVSVPANDEHFRYGIAAIEVDEGGGISHKFYLSSRSQDTAVPMKLVRYFGEPAWEVLSELVRCGVDPAGLHNHDFFVCCSRDSSGTESLTLSVTAGRDDDLAPLVYELASRHHGSTCAVDALSHVAKSQGANWRYTAFGLGFSAADGIDKLNVYGTPTWDADNPGR